MSVFFRRYITFDRDINPFEDDYGNVSEGIIYANEEGNIFLLDEDTNFLFDLTSSKGIRDMAFLKKLHPATRKEIKAAGLWDCVFNKEDYSYKEDQIQSELDEYLRIGEELSKAKDSGEKSLEDDKN